MKWVALLVGVLLFVPIASAMKLEFGNNGDILYVGGSGPGNYSKIQDAITAADDGDTVFVFNGTYTGQSGYFGVYIDKSIDLVGENKYGTIINASGNLVGVKVWVGNVKVCGFTITSATTGTSRGVEVDNLGFPFADVNISDNIITDHDWGFHNEVCRDCVLYNNIIVGNHEIGVHEYGDMGNTIMRKNVIVDNPVGVEVGWTDRPIVIEQNMFDGNDIAIKISLSGQSRINRNNFVNNTIDTHIIDGPYLIGSIGSWFKNRWDGNYWEKWQRSAPKPIVGLFVRAILIPLPGAHLFPIPLGIYPYIRFDWNPAQEPYMFG